jgi:hypothetical protein
MSNRFQKEIGGSPSCPGVGGFVGEIAHDGSTFSQSLRDSAASLSASLSSSEYHSPDRR